MNASALHLLNISYFVFYSLVSFFFNSLITLSKFTCIIEEKNIFTNIFCFSLYSILYQKQFVMHTLITSKKGKIMHCLQKIINKKVYCSL